MSSVIDSTDSENSPEKKSDVDSNKKRMVKSPWFFKTFLMMKDPIAFMREVAKLGDFVHVRGVVGFYFINHPELIKQVYKTKNDNINRQNAIYNRLKNVARTGLVTSEGEYWKKQRRTMNPLFTPKAVKGFTDKMVEASVARLGVWEKYAETGQSFELTKEMDRLTLEVNGACLFNTNFEHVYDDMQRWFDYINRYMEKIPLPIITEPWFPSISNIRLKRILSKIDTYIDQLIADRKKNLGEHTDLLTLLLKAKDEETGENMPDFAVRHEVLVAFIAGYETTSTGLSWAWYRLNENPEVAQKLRQEVDEVLGDRLPTLEDVSKLTYTKMFVEEVLRLSPPAWLTGRATIDDDQLWDATVPGKSMVLVIPPCMHEHTDYWDEPLTFDPERFDSQKERNRTPYTYIPFGGGPHVCIGKHFATLEIIITLSILVRRFELNLDPGFKPVASAGISSAPKFPMMVTVKKRVVS